MRHPLLTLAVLCGLLAPLGLKAPSALAASGAATASGSEFAAQNARVIVKFKADSTVMRKQTLSVSGTATAAQAAELHTARATALGSRVGLALTAGSGVAERAQVVHATGMSSQQLADKLAQDSDVEYAVVDQRRRAYTAPNDPYYTTGPAVGSTSGGPSTGQWYLRAPDATVKSSIDAEGAWAVSTGSAGIVVAVLDTGLRFDHADLQGGNVLPGYDFVSNTFVSNDGGGRDADASDPGDAVTAADINSASNTIGCTTSDITNTSSWHGTQTLGLIGAATNNGIGIASVGRNVRVMPVRVLGKCGGYDSDIIAGMQWAAGLAVTGVPTNTTPAKVINLSLGGSGTCSTAYTDAVAAVNAVGAVVVASAGNSEGHAVSTPANCTGVIAVAGLRHVGTKVGFSDLGPQIAISAPAGNCVNTATGSACLYPIMTLANSGAISPVLNAAGGSIYTDSFDTSLGTSFSAPLVSGTVALMLSVQPALTPAQVKSTLQSTARAFPTTGGDNGDGTVVATCTAPQYDARGNAINQDQCYCTTSTCGAGMLDAGAALRALSAPTVSRITQSPASPSAGQVLTLDGSTSSAATGRTVASYQWRLIDGGGIVTTAAFSAVSATASSISLTPTGAGTITVGLTVTDSSGVAVDATSAISVSAQVVPGVTRITQSPASAIAGQLLTLDGSTSTAATGRSLASYQWRLVDGGGIVTATAFAAVNATAASISLTPTGAGTFTLGLTVTDSSGTSVDATLAVSVAAAPAPGVTVITQSPATAVAGQTLTLDGSTSTAAAGRSVATYQWRLIDAGGIVSGFASSTSASSITLTPSAAGSFTVGLTVTDSAGTSVDASRVIAVSAAAAAVSTSTTSTSSSGGGALGLPWLVLLGLACVAAARSHRAARSSQSK